MLVCVCLSMHLFSLPKNVPSDTHLTVRKCLVVCEEMSSKTTSSPRFLPSKTPVVTETPDKQLIQQNVFATLLNLIALKILRSIVMYTGPPPIWGRVLGGHFKTPNFSHVYMVCAQMMFPLLIYSACYKPSKQHKHWRCRCGGLSLASEGGRMFHRQIYFRF